jgi:hypothetical protein
VKLTKTQRTLCLALVIAAAGTGLAAAQVAQQPFVVNATALIPQDIQVLEMLVPKS